MKTELKTKSTSLLLVTIMLCSIFTGAVTADVTKSAANTSLALGNPRSCIGCAGYEPWYYYAGGIVNTANGNLYFSEEKDISIKARGFDIELVRSYNSHNSGKYGPFGFGWTFNYNIYLVKNKDGSVTFFDEDGSAHSFASEGGNNYTAPPGIHSKLVKNADGSFTLWFTDGSKYNFGSNGKINNITDKNDNHLNFEYNILGRLTRISDDSGLYLNLNYNLHGRISSVVDPLGMEIRYEYNASDLTKVTDAMGHSTRYEYYDNHKLKNKVDRVDSMLIFSYYDDGKVKDVKASKYGEEDVMPFTLYKLEYATNITYVTDASGDKTKIEHNSNGNPIKITDPLGGVTMMNWDSDMNIVDITDANGHTASFNYDDYGNLIKETNALGSSILYEYNNIDTDSSYISLLTKITNARGFTTSFAYNAKGNQIKITDAQGNNTSASYDGSGNLISGTDFRGYMIQCSYDTHGYLVNLTDTLGGVTTYSYDSVGRLLAITDANGHSTSYEYDHNNNLVKVTDALGNETKYEYNAEGTLTNTIDANGHQTKASSNTLGDYDGIEDAAGNEISFKYDKNGNPIKITNEKGDSSEITYDALNRPISVTDALGNTKYFEYDALSNLISVTDANAYVTTYAYDAINQLVRTTDALGHTTSFSYDANGNSLSIKDANGHSTEYVYDAMDRIIKTEDALGNEKTYSYDANGNLLSITDANGHSRRFEYDTLNRPIAVISPLGYRTQYEYDAVRNLITKIDANGNTTNYSYNELDRLISTSYPYGGRVTKDYDAVGNHIKISSIGIGLNDVTEFSYNELNRLASATQNYGSFSKTIKYTCDASGNRETVEYPDGGISTSVYDGMDRLIKLTNPAGEVTSYQYDKAGRRTGILYPNRVTATYSYDAAGRILSLVNEKSTGEIISSYTYTYDNVGNRLIKTEADKAVTKYEYDALYQLTNVTYPSGDITRYTYDAAGNRLSEENGNSTISYIYDADDRLVTANGTSYYYDNNGNLIREIDANGTTHYEYDYEKRLTRVTLPDASEVSYHYSPLGGRLAKTDRDGTTTYYLYDFEHLFHKPEDILMELDVGGAQKAIYTHGPGVDEPISLSRDGVTSYYLFDALGSVTTLTDVYENVVASYQYDAFGKILEQTGTVENPYKFTSREHDEGSGLYYYRARYYDATVGRFLTKDPLAITLAVNLYSYVDNNPVNMADPSGHGFWSDCWQAFQTVGNAVVNAATWVGDTVVATGQAITNTAGAVTDWVQDQWNWWSAFGSECVNHCMDYWTIITSADYWLETGLPILAVTAGVMLIVAMPQILCAFPEALSAAGGWIVGTAIPTTIAYGIQAMLYIPVVGGFLFEVLSTIILPGLSNPSIAALLGMLLLEYGPWLYSLFGSNEGSNTDSIEGFKRRDTDKKPQKRHTHPDDNYDVSVLSYSSSTATTFNYQSEEVAILANGFYNEFSNLLTELGESTTFVDVYTPLGDLNDYPILIIPSGGFSGISSLSSFKSKLENYVKDGGTLIVYSQNHGYEFDAVPGDLSGYGWTEDQACHHRSVAINTYHPILSGQDSVTLDVVVDGYFTTYPEDATILLTRTKNGMPAMLMYEYGNGTVITITTYTDWAYGHHQATSDGKHLVRDMVVWAKNPEELPEYASADAMDIPINVTSYIDLTSDKVKFEVIADNEVIDTVEVTTSIPPYETKTVNFTYTAPSKFGILHIDYLLVNDSYGEVQRVHDAQKFEVSKYAENPDGFVYRGKELQIWATSSDDYVAKGSEVVFSVYVRNNGDDSLKGNIGIYGHEQGGAWWAYYDNISNISLPPHSEDSFTYTHKMEHSTAVYFGLFDHPVDHNALSMRGFSQKAIAKCERGVWTFSPSVDIGVETDEEEYTIGEEVCISLNFTNNQKVNHNATVTVRTLDSVNKKIYEESFDANLSAYESTNKTLSFSIPKDSSHGTCIVTAEAFENEEKIGSNSTYFELPKTYRIRVDYDKTNKVYGIRQNLSLSLNITNTGSSVWSSWVNTTIPSLSFFDSKFLSFNPNENREIEYKNLAVPADLTPGKHGVFVHLSYGSTTKKDNFFIPCSDLRIEAGKKNNAGENFSFNISNVGGVDTAFNCSFEFRDWKRGKMIYEGVVEDTVLSLNNKTISFEIPNQSVNGLYYLIVSCKDIKTGKETELAAKCEVSGLKADLTSDTERRVYFKNENVSILTNITNQNGEIENGTLNLKIVRVSMPNSTGQALARATAKLSGYKYKLEEHNIVMHNSSHSSSHNSSTPQSPSPPPTNFLPGLSLYNLIATARAASPPANLTPTPEHEPENETGELPIEELSPTPSINVTLTPEHEPLAPPTDEVNESYDNESLPEEPVLSPTINVTPSPTPEPEEELAEIYKRSATKLSDIIIGNETVWKDEIKTLTENLIVNSTGNLTLINTTVIMNCSSDGQYHIEVQNGGEMHIFDSEITAKNTNYEYYFQVKSGAKFEMRDSELHECGYTWGTNGDHAGLWINTNDTIIENNLITNSYCGIVLYQSNNNTLVNNTANSNGEYDIYLSSSNNNTLTSNTANLNRKYGIYLSSSNNNTLTSNIANSHSYHGIYLSSSNNNTLTSNTANSNERYGIYLSSSSNNTLTSNTANSNEHYWGDHGHGIYLVSSSNNTLTSNTANSNRKYGIVLSSSNNNSLTSNTANLNHDHGIYLHSSNNNSLTSNTASSNKYYHGIYLSSSNNNTLTSNTANLNHDHGIYLSSSSNNVLTNNTAKENNVYDLFIHATSVSHCNNRIDNTTGSGDRPIKYFKSSVNLSDEHFSELILCNADNSDINNITVEGSSTKKNNGVLLVQTDFSNLTSINSSGNHHGVYLGFSHNNTLTSNIMTGNSQSGIYLYDSCNNNTLKNNSAHSNSQSGIYLNDHSNNNTITNNSVHSNSYYGGIYLNDHSNINSIENNTISSNSDGISLRGSCNNNAIGNNTIESNGNGVSFSDASNNNAIENNTIKNNYNGISLGKSHNNRIINNNLSSNRNRGIRLSDSGSNTLEGNRVEKSKETGIHLSSSSSNKIINNTVISNNGFGIHLYYWYSSDNNNIVGNNVSCNSNYGIAIGGTKNILVDNIVNSNGGGIELYGEASNSILRNNTINSNSGWGIYMSASSYNTLFNNSINDNNRNFGVEASHHDWDKHFNHSIDTSNTINGKPIYYIVNEKDKIYDETTNAGYFAAVFCENITIKNLNNLTNNSEAVLFRKTHHSHIENISGMLNSYGINLMHSDNNTVSNSNLSTNSEHGLYMWYSSGDEIRNCNISSNDKHGVYISPSSNNNRMDSCIISSNEERGIYINDHSNNNRIDNCAISSNEEHGVYINDRSNSNGIRNSSITSNGRSGITIDGWTYNCELNNNSISLNNDYGIYIRAGSSNKIFNNAVNSINEGIYLRDGTNNILRNNNVTSNSYPLYFRNVGSIAQDIDTTNTLNGFKAIALLGVNNVTVTNLSVIMPDKIKVTNFGIINLANCKNISIENVTIVNHSAYGIFVYKSSGNVIANCTINSNDRGIYLYQSELCDILNNVLNNNRIGVRYNSEDLYHCNIKGNEMNSNSEHGIYIVGCCGSSGETSISDNIMSYNGKRGIYISRTGGNVLINNNTLNSNEDGIYVSQAVYEATNFHVSNNTITNNDNYGIYFDGAKNNDFSIASNIIKANNYGLYGKGHLDANLIYDNFFENTINAYDDGQNTWNITKTFAENGNIIGGPWLGGNYWSDYEGEDEDGDEIGDTLLPYNCSGRIKEGGDYLPLVMPLPPKAVLWEKNITINLAEGETENIVSEVPASVFKDVTGKQKLSTTFYSNTMQIINISDPFFYVTPKNTSLTLETDKRVYKPNETVLIYGEVKNHASTPADCNLSINKDGAEIFSDSFTLATDGTRYYATNTTADASFNLEGTVDGVVVLDSLSVESPEINASIIAPDVVGIKDFDIGVLIENIGNITAELNVSLDGKRWNITVPEGESQLLETSMNTSRNMTITVIISGDVTETIQKEIICGENAKINITPEPTYLEGEAEIPFTINNTGVLDSEFNATFSISSPEEQNITKHFFVPKGENITDCVSFNLTKGAHLLRYTSPFETVNRTINVLSPPEFIVASIHPAELNFTIGENVTLVFRVKNVGGSEGEAALKLSMIDFEDTNRTWIIAGAEENISFNLTIPDDLEEKSYKGIYVLAGTRSEFTFFVQGANISVDASLDKSMYAEGDTAVLTLELTNECRLDLDLYSRVKFNEYDSVQNFTLAGSGTETLVFYLPANFSGDNKVLYTVYMDSGRALYINSIYIYEELPDVPLRLFTDKDVYNMGEEVTIHIVDVTGTDMLNLTAPNFSYNDTISGPTTLEFTLPALRSGTYYIEYRFGNLSSTHPFDVIGYSARILEASLDKEEYISGNEMKLEMNIEANRDVSGLLKTWTYDPEENLIDEFEMNKRLIAGENKIELCRTLSTDKSGIHAIVYGFSAELSGDSATMLVSGAEYFDAESVGLCGDVAPYPDCNGIVDMGDVILLLNNVSYPENPRYVLCNDWAGDCRCTGVRDMGDVILLLNNVSYPEDPGYVLDCC